MTWMISWVRGCDLSEGEKGMKAGRGRGRERGREAPREWCRGPQRQHEKHIMFPPPLPPWLAAVHVAGSF